MYDGTAAVNTAELAGAWCRHCRRRMGTRARGLCTACHRDPAVRAQYPSSRGKGGGCKAGRRAPRNAPCRADCGRRATQPRGLCWTCYYTPGVRALFPSVSKFARQGRGTDNHCRGLPQPTEAEPGTEDKVRVLEERARQGLSLHHPDDVRADCVRRRPWEVPQCRSVWVNDARGGKLS